MAWNLITTIILPLLPLAIPYLTRLSLLQLRFIGNKNRTSSLSLSSNHRTISTHDNSTNTHMTWNFISAIIQPLLITPYLTRTSLRFVGHKSSTSNVIPSSNHTPTRL
jgi:hypothetical protein